MRKVPIVMFMAPGGVAESLEKASPALAAARV